MSRKGEGSIGRHTRIGTYPQAYINMGITAENVAENFSIVAFDKKNSHSFPIRNITQLEGYFDTEISPMIMMEL